MKSKYQKIVSFASAAILCCSASAFAGTHEISDINGLQTALDSKADQSAVDAVSATVDTKADQTALDAVSATVATKADQTHGHFYGNMTVVATSGGEYTSPVDAVTDIANWCSTPSADNPCLIKMGPGLYDLGTASLVLPEHVNIKGAGELSTIIRSAPDNIDYDLKAVVNAAGNGISDMTIQFVGANQVVGYGLVIQGDAVIRNVTVEDVPGTVAQNSIPIMISNTSNPQNYNVKLENVIANASQFVGTQRNYGIQLTGGANLKMNNVHAVGNIGTGSYGMGLFISHIPGLTAVVDVTNSVLESDSRAIYRQSGIVNVVNTKIASGTIATGVNCLNVYDSNLSPVVCP